MKEGIEYRLDLPVGISEHDRLEAATELAESLRKKREVEDKKSRRINRLKNLQSEVAKKLNDKISNFKEVIDRLAFVVETGTKEQSVCCVVTKNIEEKIMELRREDTGEIIDSRALTPEDMQEELNLEKEESKNQDNEVPES